MDKSRKDVLRRDATGHLDESHARRLLEESGQSPNDKDDKAFLQRPRSGESLSEELGEAYIQSATSGEESEVERQDSVVVDEQGGPFVPTTGSEEFAPGTDASNIEGASREPLPKTSKANP